MKYHSGTESRKGRRVSVFLLSCLFSAWLLSVASAAAQTARVMPAPEIAMPTGVDCNSPAFWRDGRLFWFGSHGRPWLSEGESLHGPWTTTETGFDSSLPWPKWLESVSVDEDGIMCGWYHTEPIGLIERSGLTAPQIGAVVSLDGGRTLIDLGIVLESGDPLDPSSQNGYFVGGHGDCSVVLNRDRRFFYFFFDNYGGPESSQGVCLARMAFDDRFAPNGKVFKFHNGSWSEAGKGGAVTPLFPVARTWQSKSPDALWGPSVHWNTYLQCFVMLMSHAQGEPGWAQAGVFVSFCTDLSRPETWTVPVKILDKAEFPAWYFFYPQVMGLEAGGTDTEAGRTARLYVGGISRWEIAFSFKDRASDRRWRWPLPVPGEEHLR